MRFGLLGSLVATRDDGKSIPLPAGKPRVVLTALLLCPNVVVGVDRLIDAVWEEQPPDSARQTIQFFVHKLRKALVSAGELGDAVVSTEAGGYLVRVASDALDVSTFERLVARARFELDDSRPSEAAQTFAAALALWRGPALAEVAEARFAQPIIGRLDELRVAALEDLAEARLALGQHAQLVPELEALVRAHPVRERLRGQLILALYRSQRQAEALQAYRDLRRRFAGELGVEPSPDLRRLEQAILRQDPELDVPHRTTARPVALDPAPEPDPLLGRPAASPGEQPLEPEAAAAAGTGPPPSPARAAAAGQAPQPVRRLVSVLAAGPAAPSADPEVVQVQRAWLLDRITDEVARFGGEVHTPPGSSALVVFGVRQARDDDPERAVRAALLICGLAKGARRLRVGVATGQALVVPTRGGVGELTGAVVDSAAALQAAAPAGGVLVGATTYRATREAITYAACTGSAPAEGWRPIAPRAQIGIAAEAEAGRCPALVEREWELGLLRHALNQGRISQEPQFVTVIGEPGIGKTRLIHELGRLVEADPDLIVWRQGRCAPTLGASGELAFQPLAEIVVAHAGILPTDPSPAVRTKLRQAMTAIIPDSTQAATVADRLGMLVCQDPSPPSPDPEQQPAVVVAWTEFVEALACNRSTVVIIEDLHEADASLLDAVEGLADRIGPVPLLVVGTARPELLARRPAWGGGKRNATTITLGPLTSPGSTLLLDGLLATVGADLPGTIRSAVLARAAGNPLYLREYARMLTDRAELAQAGGELPIPETVQQVIAARLDALPPDDLALLADLAVLGDVGAVDVLRAVSGQDAAAVGEGLARLARRELVRRARGHGHTGPLWYGFCHPLVREVAYQQLLRPQRAVKHQRAAAWLEGLPADRADHLDQLAHHYEQAITASGPDGLPAELVAGARAALRVAGRHAMRLGALGVAARRLRQAQAIWPASDPELPALLLELGRALTYSTHSGQAELIQARDGFMAAGRPDQAAAAEAVLGHLARIHVQLDQAGGYVDSALARPVAATPAQVEALVVRAIDHLVADRHDSAVQVADQVIELAQTLELPAQVANGRSIRSQARLMSGDLHAIDPAEQALADLDAHRHPMRALAHFGFAHALYWSGELGRCGAAIAAGRQTAALADAGMRTWFDALEAGLAYQTGLWADAEALAGRLLADDPAGHSAYLLPWSWSVLARIALGRGDLDQALTSAHAAVEAAEAAGDLRAQHLAGSVLGRVLLAAGRHDQATAALIRLLGDLATEAARGCATPDLGVLLLDLASSGGSPPSRLPDGLPPTRWHQAVQALAGGDLPGAADRLAALGAHLDEAAVRLRLARELSAAGHPDPAADQADQAASVFRKAGASHDLHHAETLLAAGVEPWLGEASLARGSRSRP